MLKGGYRQACKDNECLNKNQKVGEGVYVSPYFLTSLLEYSQIEKDTDCFVVFQCRVKPNAVKIVKNIPNYWVVSERKHLRPYGMVLFTKAEKEQLEKFIGNGKKPEDIHKAIYKQEFTELTWKNKYQKDYDAFHR